MLSLIICSRDAAALAAVSQNVADTVGAPYELVVVDNSRGQYGICEAYNLAAARAQYPLLCFMHEDIRFHTPGWGRIVSEILADDGIGALGVAGSTRQLAVPSAWWWAGEACQRMQVLHAVPGLAARLDYQNPQHETLAEVAVLDGLWICTRREVWQAFPFDQRTFPEFHFYDVDFTTALYGRYRVCVTYAVLIEHFSTGSINDQWLINAIRYQQKWQARLPFGPGAGPAAETRAAERSALYNFMLLLLDSRLGKAVQSRYLLQLFAYRPITRDYLWMLKKLLRNVRRA